MFETKFFINGKKVDEAQAQIHWLKSNTYQRARCGYRDRVFKTAVYGDRYGNHNPNGELSHLKEAGITLSA